MRVATPDRAVGHVVDAVRDALAVREAMLPTWHAEGSDTYRLLHGATEHLPGCTLDRYGSLLLWQTFREPPCDVAALLPALRELVCAELPDSPELTPAWTDRSRGARARASRAALTAAAAKRHVARELGLRFVVPTPEAARDPALFLDFRSGRRWLRRHCDGADVLNVFAYTCAPPLLPTGTTPRGQLMPTPWSMEFLVSDRLRINPRFKID